jgi:hypothetical protein
MTATTERPALSMEELTELFEIVHGSDSIELKLTVGDEAQRSAIRALDVDPLDAQIRQVYFFDTPGLDLSRAGVVARARRVQGKAGDSVVKLRPVMPSALPDHLRASPNLVVEVDAMPGGYVCSATMKRKTALDDAREVAAGQRPIRKLFSKEQRKFFELHAPEGIGLDDLSVLGPIFVLKLKFEPAEFARALVTEMWLYPDGSRILELSTKCLPGEGMRVAKESRDFLESRGISLAGEQQTKTKRALEFFAAELAGS